MSWNWLLPPGGGRAHLDLDIAGDSDVVTAGDLALLRTHDGAVHRVDLAAVTATQVGTTPVEAVAWHLAIHPRGAWAVSDRAQVYHDGRTIERADVYALAFGDDGDLWALAVSPDEIIRFDGATGAVKWTAANPPGRMLAVTGDSAVVARWGAIAYYDGNGTVDERKLALEDNVTHLVARDGKAYLLGASGTQRSLAICDVATREERVLTLPDGYPRTPLPTADGKVIWSDNGGFFELDAATGETRTFPAPALSYTTWAVSADDRSLAGFWPDGSAVARVDRATGAEVRPAKSAPDTLWDVSVAPDGRVATAHTGEWRVTSKSGETVHREEVQGGGQATCVAFSPDGSKLAVYVSATSLLRVFDSATWKCLAARELDVSALSFDPSGARLLVVADSATIVGAEDLASQCVLAQKDSLEGAHFDGARIVATDSAHRTIVYDDPGPLPAAKKPKKIAAAITIPSTRAHPSTDRFVNPSRLGAARLFGGHLAVLSGAKGLVSFDATAPAKPLSTRSGVTGYFALASPVLVRVEARGASLWRGGESAPFATLSTFPAMVCTTADGREVVAVAHGGVMRLDR